VTATSPVVQASAGRHWYIERLASVGLLALVPAGLVYPNPAVDYGLALLVPLHGHWGLMALVKDYAPDVLKPVAEGLVYVLSIGTFAGLMYLNVRDVGICGAVRAVWSL
jgi:succinate dehydrogenase (ubiquinone) membrane anchor subunit